MAGEAIVRSTIVGLADSIPESLISDVSEMLAPLLHLPGWQTAGGLAAWAHAALLVLPLTDGAPDARAREALLTTLTGLPDPIGPSYKGVVRQLSLALTDFARVARRLPPLIRPL